MASFRLFALTSVLGRLAVLMSFSDSILRVVPRHAMLRHAMLHHAMLRHAMLRHAMLRHAMLRHAIPWLLLALCSDRRHWGV